MMAEIREYCLAKNIKINMDARFKDKNSTLKFDWVLEG